jgi:ribose transport system substrate-binding protein
LFLGGAGNKDIIKMVMDKNALVPADVTYPPSMVGSAISMAVMSAKGEALGGFYQRKIPSKIILQSELVLPENAKDYYQPESVF